MLKTYYINEIFYSLQGEGRWSGTPIVFVRFSGCNLACPFCDTDFAAFRKMSIEEILEEMSAASDSCKRVCLTGGEPSLQIDKALIEALHNAGYQIHIETNGTHSLPDGIDWITLSPKSDWLGVKAEPILTNADEIKVVYTGQDVSRWLDFPASAHYLQPCSCTNTAETLAYILEHPLWQLSLQTHKILDIR